MERVFGIDVHKDVLVTTIITDEGEETKWSGVSTADLQNLMEWLKQKKCLKGVMESSGIYWVPIYVTLIDNGFQVTVANAHQVKAIPGRKTDELDSQWLARIFSAGLVKPSYIPEKKIMELRSLTRLRVTLLETQTAFKNRVHKTLQICNIRLASKLSNIFGKDGQMLLNALVKGESIDEIIEKYGSKRLKKKKEEVKASILGALGEADIIELKICLENINRLEEQIRQLNAKIATLVNKKDVERISKVPGMGEVSASAVIAEIADPRRFQNEKKLYSWSGLAPSTYQSAGKTAKTGHITKRGNKWLRRILVQCATPAIKIRNSQIRQFYLRIRGRRGHKIAIVATARKLLGIIWHLLITGEEYIDKHYVKKTITKSRKETLKLTLEEAIPLLRQAGYTVIAPG
ncbi:MAG: IS110 family transposase [Candidatus Bathyarchaeia archaeon]